MTSEPFLASTREELQAALDARRRAGSRVALVPTMGALHDGHVALLRAARQHGDAHADAQGAVVASIFVNPLQFGAGEDLSRYPRTFEADLEICAREGVDVVFAPSTQEMYPGGEQVVTVDPGPLGGQLEGAVRPGHFRGVLTVVAKLFGLARPDLAFFGEKDYQQLVLVRRMSSDLGWGVDVRGVQTQREPDGLALSSRNRYLTADERASATVLSRALEAARTHAAAGLPAARSAAERVLAGEPAVEPDYLEIRAPDLGEIEDELPSSPVEARILVAGRLGGTRLIDNLSLTLGPVA